MFDGLISFIRATWTAFWDSLKAGLSSWWGIVIAVFMPFVGVLLWIAANIDEAVSWLAEAGLPSIGLDVPSSVVTMVTFANTFFPISECFSMLVAWGAFALALQAYRFIKSWLPTLAG